MKSHPLYTRYLAKQEIRQWNHGFTVPPVYTGGWSEADWQRWEESRKLLPEFSDCLEAFKPALVSVKAFGKTSIQPRKQAVSLLRAFRNNREGWKFRRDKVRSSVGIVAIAPDGFETVIVSYKSTLLF